MDRRLKQAILSLFQCERTKMLKLSFGEFMAVRTGRNEVWRLTSGSNDSTFVKFMNSDAHFCRELAGLRIASQLAATDPSFCSPEIVLADEAVCAIATRALSGPPLNRICRDAFRIDRNPLKRNQPVAYAVECTNRGVEWLRRFHEQPVENHAFLYDHSAQGVLERIERKLDRAQGLGGQCRMASTGAFVNARKLCRIAAPIIKPHRCALTFGDPTLGNFMFDGGRVGMIDFEDIGVGDPDRDWLTLSDSLFPQHGRWKRWNLHRTRHLVQIPAIPPEKASLYRIEFALDRFNWSLSHACPRRKTNKAIGNFCNAIQCLQNVVAGSGVVANNGGCQPHPQRFQDNY